jgi:hypothetical protein
VILAAVKSDAEALGQAATHAPHPMHWAASIATSTVSLGMSVAFPCGAGGVGALI